MKTEEQRERDRAKSRAYYHRNADKCKANALRWRYANRKSVRAHARSHYHRHAERIKAKRSQWRAANRERLRAESREYYRRIHSSLAPVYVRQLLKAGTSLKNHHIPDSVVQLSTAILKLKRLCKEKRKHNPNR